MAINIGGGGGGVGGGCGLHISSYGCSRCLIIVGDIDDLVVVVVVVVDDGVYQE